MWLNKYDHILVCIGYVHYMTDHAYCNITNWHCVILQMISFLFQPQIFAFPLSHSNFNLAPPLSQHLSNCANYVTK
jgi:hypothetical protein